MDSISHLYDKGQYQDVIHAFEALPARYQSSDLYSLKVNAEKALERPYDALITLSKWSDIEPHTPDILFQRGMLYLELGIWENAERDFSHVINSSTSDTKSIFFQIDTRGIEQVKVTTLNQFISGVYASRATARVNLGKIESALKDFGLAISFDSSAYYLNKRASYLIENNRESEALEDLVAAVQLEPGYKEAWINYLKLFPDATLPEYLFDDGDEDLLFYEAELAYHKQLIPLASRLLAFISGEGIKRVKYLILSGKIEYSQQQYILAIQIFDRVLSLEPKHKELHLLIGNANFHLKRFQEAVRHYTEYLRVFPENANAWFNLANAYFSLVLNTEACECLNMARLHGFVVSADLLQKCIND